MKAIKSKELEVLFASARAISGLLATELEKEQGSAESALRWRTPQSVGRSIHFNTFMWAEGVHKVRFLLPPSVDFR